MRQWRAEWLYSSSMNPSCSGWLSFPGPDRSFYQRITDNIRTHDLRKLVCLRAPTISNRPGRQARKVPKTSRRSGSSSLRACRLTIWQFHSALPRNLRPYSRWRGQASSMVVRLCRRKLAFDPISMPSSFCSIGENRLVGTLEGEGDCTR